MTTWMASVVGGEILQEVREIEHHLHSYERWFGIALVPNGQVHVADRIGTAVAPLQADAGNNTWGTWLQILGSSDTPADAGKTHFDLHRLMITAVERASADHYVQIGFGDSGAAALAAGNYTEFVYRPASSTAEEIPIDIQTKRRTAGTKTWLRLFIPGQNTGTFNFYLGLHEYDE